MLLLLWSSLPLIAQRDSPRGLSNIETGVCIVSSQFSQNSGETSFRSTGAGLQLLSGNVSIIDQFMPNNARLHLSDIIGFSGGVTYENWQKNKNLSEAPNGRREILKTGEDAFYQGSLQVGLGAMYTLGTFDAIGGRLVAGSDFSTTPGKPINLCYWRTDAFWFHRSNSFEANVYLPRTLFAFGDATASSMGVGLRYRYFPKATSGKYVGISARVNGSDDALQYQASVSLGCVFQDILAQRRYRDAF
jgi:hypothetical protein